MTSPRARQLAQHRAEMELAIAEGLSLAEARYELWARRQEASHRAQRSIRETNHTSPSLARTPRPEGGFYWERD